MYKALFIQILLDNHFFVILAHSCTKKLLSLFIEYTAKRERLRIKRSLHSLSSVSLRNRYTCRAPCLLQPEPLPCKKLGPQEEDLIFPTFNTVILKQNPWNEI